MEVALIRPLTVPVLSIPGLEVCRSRSCSETETERRRFTSFDAQVVNDCFGKYGTAEAYGSAYSVLCTGVTGTRLLGRTSKEYSVRNVLDRLLQQKSHYFCSVYYRPSRSTPCTSL